MRRFLLVLLLIAAVLVGAALILPALLPAEAWRGRVETAASEALGREVTIEGDIAFSVLPRVQARAGSVRIANAEGFGDEPFAAMEQMRLSLQLMPLLRRELVIEEFVLVDPLIRLEQRGARNNWSFGTGERAPAAQDGDGFRQPGALPLEASFGDVRIQNGTLIYTSAAETRRFEAVDLALDLPSLDAPARLRGNLTLDGRRLDLSAGLGSLRAFFEGGRTALDLSVTGPIGEIGFDGHVLESRELEYEGAADLDLVLPELAALFGAGLPEGEAFRRLTARGQLAGSPGRASLSEASLGLDAIGATGSATLNYAGARPALDARVDIAELDLNPYLPQAEGQANGTMEPWSEDRIDLSALDLLDARVRGRVGRLLVNEIEVSDAELDAALERSRLEANFTGFQLYGGRGTARLVANNRTRIPTYAFAGELQTLEALPFLQAAAGFDRLRGIGTLGVDVSGSGASTAAIMNSLSGQGAFDFADGAIVGVNLARLIRGVLTALETRELPDAFGEQAETDFSALRGTFDIANGVASNRDLTMLSPLLRVGGQGQVNLGAQRLDYRLTPRAVASLTGQGGESDLQGVPVPIIISGSFSDPSISLDFGTIARNLVQARAQGQLGDLGQILDLERVREEGPAGILSILTGSRPASGQEPAQDSGTQPQETPAQTAEPQTDEERARDVIQGIFGAVTRAQQEREEQPADEDAGTDPNP